MQNVDPNSSGMAISLDNLKYEASPPRYTHCLTYHADFDVENANNLFQSSAPRTFDDMAYIYRVSVLNYQKAEQVSLKIIHLHEKVTANAALNRPSTLTSQHDSGNAQVVVEHYKNKSVALVNGERISFDRSLAQHKAIIAALRQDQSGKMTNQEAIDLAYAVYLMERSQHILSPDYAVATCQAAEQGDVSPRRAVSSAVSTQPSSTH